jgi:hypothetical protein
MQKRKLGKSNLEVSAIGIANRAAQKGAAPLRRSPAQRRADARQVVPAVP